MLITLKTKIWLTVLSIVLMFTFFTLFYFPYQQGKQLLKNYKSEVQNLANTVALGVDIAMTEQNYEGIRTSMNYLADDPRLKSVSLIQFDTVWDDKHERPTVKRTVVSTFPNTVTVTDIDPPKNDSIIYKKAPFITPSMTGSILLAYKTDSINESKKKIRKASLLVSAIVLLVGILLGFWLSKKISLPVLALRDAAIRVGEGDLSKRIEKFTNDEIGELGIAFNKMTDQLYESRKILNETNLSLSESNESLNKTLVELKATQTQLVQSEKMASLGELTAGIAHEIQNPLNFVINFSEVSADMLDEIKRDYTSGNIEEGNAKTDDLDQNLQKVIYHGKRADAIVKNMLQHSRSTAGVVEAVDINNLVDEYLRLSYHGLRAKNKAFNATLETNFDKSLEKINLISQDIGRVILNIFTNAFYSVTAKKAMNPSFSPVVSISTKKVDPMVEIRIRDNGTGIPEKVLDKIFQPFFTTKPTGQGTGLGLSLSYDIVKAHYGKIIAETMEGEFAEFIIYLPLKYKG